MNTKILENVRILDFTRILAGPFATRILGDFGAEIIKVQSRVTANGAESNTATYFQNWNRNKRSITLDLRHPEARELTRRLVAISDVVMENFSPRVMANWGFTYSELQSIKPDLIMTSLSGMGQTGPWQNKTAFGPTVQALGGLTHLNAYQDDEPIGAGYAYVDPMAGLFGAYAILAALEYRDRTGEGEYIDLSAYEVASSLIGPTLMDVLANQTAHFDGANRANNAGAAPHGCYPCAGKDRWCVIAVFNAEQWRAFGEALGNPDWIGSERFASFSNRRKYGQELDEMISAWTSARETEAVVERLQNAGVPAGVVQDARDIEADPQLAARSFFADPARPHAGGGAVDAPVIRFSDHSTRHWRTSPFLGEANAYVFLELLNLTRTEYDAFVDQGVIG